MRPLLTPTQGRIVRALVLFLSKDGKKSVSVQSEGIVVEAVSSQEWASLTFSGEKHHLVVRLPADVPDIALDGTLFDLPGTIVAIEHAAWATSEAGPRLTIDLLAIGVPGCQ